MDFVKLLHFRSSSDTQVHLLQGNSQGKRSLYLAIPILLS